MLECLGGNNPRAPGYFAFAEDSNIFEAFAKHIASMSRQWATQSDPHAISLLAAGRLLTGDLSAANVILDHLPAKAVKLDHGAGFCLVAPLDALRTALPLPADVLDRSQWLADSQEQARLRAWLAQYRDQLRWIEADGIYRLPKTSGHARAS